MSRFGRSAIMAAAIISLVASGSKAGPKWDIDDDSWMKLSFLGQVHGSYTDTGDPEMDVFLRRARIILSGQIADGVLFFAETDNDNAGKSGATDSSTDVQDIFLDVRIMDSDHWVKAGLILVPFSFETRASAATLLGLDYNSECVKLVNTFVWRDYGVELHGEFFDKTVAYAVGVFDGYDSATGTKNRDADERVTGHIAVNLIGDVETGWFYGQNRLGSERYLSIGAGYDRQDKATSVAAAADAEDQTPEIVDSEAWVVDFQSGTQIGSVGLTVNGGWYDWDSATFVGSTAFVEAGVLLGKTMLTGKVSRQDPDAEESVETEDYTAGLHYFMNKHNARGGVEYSWGDSADKVLVGLQFLL